ncbi:bifunctional phosphoribosyl-AMP cyclohydrolase/phosphoribosyl-ATP diphosphatase HisIE [soil metagenome]
MWIDELKFDGRGLVPVVAQEIDTGEVLMLAYANHDALTRTVESGAAHYWSRSRAAIWRKGESSGHVQIVEEVRVDCDGDSVLYRVRQTGPACHTGERSCFHRANTGGDLASAAEMGHILARLERIIATRDVARPEGSYTTYLFEQGIDKILKKVGEETTETVIAAKNSDPVELRNESADLLFHLLVLFRASSLPLRDVWSQLEARFGSAPRDVPASQTDTRDLRNT